MFYMNSIRQLKYIRKRGVRLKDNVKALIDSRIFDFMYEIALNDATNRVSKKGDKEKVLENESIKATIMTYANTILKGEANDSLFSETVKRITKIVNQEGGGIEGFSFGKIQKLINMTMKYLYIEYCQSSRADNFKACHAPMDSVMRNFVFESYCIIHDKTPGFSSYRAWSTITEINGDYSAFQTAIDDIIMCKELPIHRLEFDYLFWNQAKIIQGRKKKDQRTLVEGIWEEFDVRMVGRHIM